MNHRVCWTVWFYGTFLTVKMMLLRYVEIHKDKMADTSAHYKQMENFMGAKIGML